MDNRPNLICFGFNCKDCSANVLNKNASFLTMSIINFILAEVSTGDLSFIAVRSDTENLPSDFSSYGFVMKYMQ